MKRPDRRRAADSAASDDLKGNPVDRTLPAGILSQFFANYYVPADKPCAT
jgi:hypothetical protein